MITRPDPGLAGTAGTFGNADGTGAAAKFNYPHGVAVDAAGNVYVADAGNHTIRKITAAGGVTTLAGTAGAAGSADGTGAAAKFNYPRGVAVDAAGNVYVADAGNHTIRKITAAGGVSTLAGSAGTAGSVDGAGAAARFDYPTGVAVDAAGNVYVADINNHTIRKITTAGVVTTLAGAAGVLGSSAGSGTAATFGYPTGVAVDAAGNVYVADYYNYTIRKITAAGVVTTLAGKAGEGGSADGTGPKARFDAPSAITIDSAGNMYVADLGNHTIRKISPGYHLGGTVSGLTGTLILQNSNGETKTISGDGSFTLDMPVAARAAYSVTVKTQPANGQTCSVNSGGGTATTHVSNIAVSCTTGASVATYTLGGAVNGLSTPLIGTLVLQNSNGDTRIIAGNGLFTFTAPVAQAAAYSVTVTTQPNGQTCTVGSGSGTATADVSTIAVSCVASTYTIGVVVGGLTGTLALRNNGTDTLTITTNANFTFATRITHGGTYNVTVMNQPAGQTCTVRDALSANASGTAKGDVGTITVNCVANTYTIGGAVSGLSGGALVLQNNLGDNLSLTASGSLTFATAITHGGAYNVTVLTQPAGQTCTVTAGGIGMATTNVTNVAVNCVISGGGGTTFTISGTVNGLNSVDLVLQNNGGDNLQVFPGAPGMPVPFTFATPVTGTYVVTVLTNPATENCTVTSGGSGTATVDVSDVVIDCATRP